MTERDWPGEAEQILRNRFEAQCRSSNQPVPMFGLRISPPLAPEEAKRFVSGVEAELFEIDDNGAVHTSLLPPMVQGDAAAFRIFAVQPSAPGLIREAVCQLSTASALVLERGWLQRQIELEPTTPNHDPLWHGVDMLVKSLAGELLAGVVVKRSPAELEKLKRDLHQCCRRGTHPQDNCGFPQNHAKYEFCAGSKPPYVWAVAPGAEVCFRMHYPQAGTITLQEMASLPPRSIVELENQSRAREDHG